MIDPREIDDFLAIGDYSKDTYPQYRRFLTLLSAWLDEHGIPLEELRPAQFLDWLDSRQGWGPVVRHNALYCARSFLKSRGLLEHPLLWMRLRRPDPGPQRTLSMEDVGKLLQACERGRPKDLRDGAMVRLLVDSGLRASELVRLELISTDLDNCRLSVMGKGRRWRHCVFSTATAGAIRAWLPMRDAFAGPDVGALFVSVGGLTPGAALSRYGLTCLWKDLAQRAGLAALSSHDFRRTFAVESARRRMPLRALQLQGGWATATVAAQYLSAMTLEDARNSLPGADLPM